MNESAIMPKRKPYRRRLPSGAQAAFPQPISTMPHYDHSSRTRGVSCVTGKYRKPRHGYPKSSKMPNMKDHRRSLYTASRLPSLCLPTIDGNRGISGGLHAPFPPLQHRGAEDRAQQNSDTGNRTLSYLIDTKCPVGTSPQDPTPRRHHMIRKTPLHHPVHQRSDPRRASKRNQCARTKQTKTQPARLA